MWSRGGIDRTRTINDTQNKMTHRDDAAHEEHAEVPGEGHAGRARQEDEAGDGDGAVPPEAVRGLAWVIMLMVVDGYVI